MDLEMLIALMVFTEKAIAWNEVNESIQNHIRRGVLIPRDIQDAFRLLGDDLDFMLETAPPEVVGIA